jgi:hypothetical protein
MHLAYFALPSLMVPSLIKLQLSWIMQAVRSSLGMVSDTLVQLLVGYW